MENIDFFLNNYQQNVSVAISRKRLLLFFLFENSKVTEYTSLKYRYKMYHMYDNLIPMSTSPLFGVSSFANPKTPPHSLPSHSVPYLQTNFMCFFVITCIDNVIQFSNVYSFDLLFLPVISLLWR